MSIDDRNRIRIRNRDLIRLDPDKFAMLLMQLVDCEIPPTPSTLVHIPEVRELRQERSWYILYAPIPDVREDKVEEWHSQ